MFHSWQQKLLLGIVSVTLLVNMVVLAAPITVKTSGDSNINWHYTDLLVGDRVKRGYGELDLPEAYEDYGGGAGSSNTNAAPARTYPGSGAAYPQQQTYTQVNIKPAAKSYTLVRQKTAAPKGIMQAKSGQQYDANGFPIYWSSQGYWYHLVKKYD